MTLAEELRNARKETHPIDSEGLKDAIRNYVAKRSGINRVCIEMRHISKNNIEIGKWGEIYIPHTWEQEMWNWAIENGFQPSLCRGVFELQF